MSQPPKRRNVNGYLTFSDWTTFNAKQDNLVSGTNIKTINGSSVLGSGDLVIAGGVTSVYRHDFNIYDYLGIAPANSLEVDDVWKITRLTIASNGSVTSGVANDVNWTDRYTHIYS